MTAFEMYRKFEKLDENAIRTIGIESVLENSEIVIQDAITSNIEGKTFAGNEIKKYPPFSDWEETGEFHDNLKFSGSNDIDFTSSGPGAEAVFQTFPELDTIAQIGR